MIPVLYRKFPIEGGELMHLKCADMPRGTPVVALCM